MTTARSTRLGSAVVGGLLVVGFGSVVLVTDTPELALAMVAAGVLIGIAVALRRTTSPVAQGGAAILVPLAAVVETVGIGLLLARGFEPNGLADAGLLIGVVLTVAMLAVPLSIGVGAMIGGIGLVATVRSEVDGFGLGQVIKTAMFTLVLIGAVFGTSLALRMAVGEAVLDEWLDIADEAVTGATGVIGAADPLIGLLVFFVLLIAAGFTGFHALRNAPVTELAPSTYRSHVERATTAATRLARGVAVIGLIGAIILVMSAESGTIESAVSSDGAIRTVVMALGSEGLQWGLVVLTGGFAVVWGTIGLLQTLTGGVSALLQWVVPASAGAAMVIGFAAIEFPSVIDRLRAEASRAPEPIAAVVAASSQADLVLLLAGLALTVLVLTLVGFITVSVMGLVPNRSMGGVLIGAGLGLGAIAMALDGGSPVAVYGVLGLALLSWDVSDRSSRAVADLGRGAGPAVSVELLHWLASAGVALLGVIAAVGLLTVARGARPLPVTEYTLAALAAVAVAVALLVAIIRG